MTQNEKIAEVMGWEPESYPGCAIGLINKDIRLAKLLQAKMVQDGWIFYVEQGRIRKDYFAAAVAKDDETSCCPGTPEVKFGAEADTEPAAIVALFCKVYGIKK